MPRSPRPLPCGLSVDLDDAWAYRHATAQPDWAETPTTLPLAVGRLRALLREHAVTCTLFVVAGDLEHPDRLAALRPLVDDGHEIGCHSHTHDSRFATLDRDAMREEVVHARDRTQEKLGVRPMGFRAPGFAVSPLLPDILREAGFTYDASPLRTIVGPVGRLYYFFRSGMSRAERAERASMFGSWRDALASQRPRLHPGSPPLLSIPLTTVPLLRVPFHMSYVLWLATYSEALARAYLAFGLGMCRALGVAPSYLLHTLDFVGGDERPDLAFFPAMSLSWERKRALLDHLMRRLVRDHRVMPLRDFADEVGAELVAAECR